MLDTIDRIAADFLKPQAVQAAEEGIFQQDLWSALCDVGITTAMLPESAGGLNLGLRDMCNILERCAYHAMPVPIAETVLTMAFVSAFDPDWSSPIATALIARLRTAQNKLIMTASLQKNDETVARVPWAAEATVLCLIDQQSTISWIDALLDPWQITGSKRNLAGEPRHNLSINKVTKTLSGVDDGLLSRFEHIGALIRTAQMCGAMERTLQLSIQYANERKQFGRPIGKFQAVQHMLAVLASHAAAAKAAYQAALDVVGSEAWSERTHWSVAIAKARMSEAAGLCGDLAHQVHGAMGFTREHHLHRFTRRLYAWRDEFGHETYWQGRVGAWTLELGADALWDHLVRH
jgi:acyl-CoA dehydrogenase